MGLSDPVMKWDPIFRKEGALIDTLDGTLTLPTTFTNGKYAGSDCLPKKRG